MDTERQENNTALGVVVVILVVLLIGLLAYLVFFLPKDGNDVSNDSQDAVEQEQEEDVQEDVVTEEEESEEEEEETEEVDESTDNLEEEEVRVTYMGDAPFGVHKYFEDAEGKKYYMTGVSLDASDVDGEFVIKVESEEELEDGVEVTGDVMHFRIVTYKGMGEDVHEDYEDYIYFERSTESGKEVYFLKNYGLSITVDSVYEFMFDTLEELDGAAGTTYWKMRGNFEYVTH